MNSVSQGESLMKSAGERTRNGGSWAGWCQSFVYRFTGATKSADTAHLAYLASGHIQSKDPKKAIPGCIHWWSDGGAGHVAVAINSDGLAAMASATASEYGTKWGTGSGSITVAAYNARHGNLNYLGWTYDFEGQYMTDVRKHLDAETAKEQAAAEAAKKAKAEAAAKAAAEEKAKKAAEEKATAVKLAEAKALQAAADAAKPVAQVNSIIPMVKEHSHAEVYLLDGLTKIHVSKAQFEVFVILGATYTEVPDGSLSAFKTVVIQ